MKYLAGLAALILLIAVPSQGAIEISTDAEEGDETMIAAGGSGEIDFTVTMDCQDFLSEGSASVEVTVSASGPEWLNGSDSTVTFEGTDCPGTAPDFQLDRGGSITVTDGGTVDAMMSEEVTLSTDLGDDTATAAVMVEYQPSYEFSADADFPLEVGSDPVSFNITMDVSGANAPSMAMFDKSPSRAEFGSLSGLPDFHNFDPLDDGLFVSTVTYTPGGGGWEEDHVEFITYAHCICDGSLMTEEETVNWTFVNTASSGGGGGGDDDEESPGLEVGVLALGVVAVAMLLRRRD